MHKLPVFATAGRAYGFLVRELGTILRLSWFIIVVVLIVQYFATTALYATMREAIEARDPAALTSVATMLSPWQVFNIVTTVLGSAIVAVALHRVILFGDRQPGRYIHLALGKVELLFALVPIIFYSAIVGTFFLGFLVVTASSAPLFMGLVMMSAVVAFVLLAVRFTPIFPVTVVERRLDFRQTWALTRGNFWRILALWIVVVGPAWIAVAVVQFLTVGTSEPTLDAIERFEAFLFPGLIFTFVTMIIFGALGVGLLSHSYKALRGLPPDAVLTPRET